MNFISGQSISGNLAGQSEADPAVGWSKRERQLSCTVISRKCEGHGMTREGSAGAESSDSPEATFVLLMTNQK